VSTEDVHNSGNLFPRLAADFGLHRREQHPRKAKELAFAGIESLTHGTYKSRGLVTKPARDSPSGEKDNSSNEETEDSEESESSDDDTTGRVVRGSEDDVTADEDMGSTGQADLGGVEQDERDGEGEDDDAPMADPASPKDPDSGPAPPLHPVRGDPGDVHMGDGDTADSMAQTLVRYNVSSILTTH
jgi:hypothetical protein